MATFTDLKPNPSLIDSNFESYKLSLDSIPSFSTRIPNANQQLVRKCSDDQYSFNHTHLFSKTNLLVHDPHHPDKVYFLDAGQKRICRVQFPSFGLNNPELITVWNLPSGSSSKEGDYNLSLCLASDSLAVVGDGSGVLFFLDRSGSPEWKLLFHDEVCGTDRPFVVSSASVSKEEPTTVTCLLTYVQDKDLVEGLAIKNDPDSLTFVNVVECMTFKLEEDHHWALERVKRFVYFGRIDYLQLDGESNYMLCATDKSYKLVFDSSGALEDDNEDVAKEANNEPKAPAFFYYQSVEDMIVWVTLPEDINKKDIKVVLKPKSLEVNVKGEIKIGGELWNVLDSDSMSWTIQKGRLEINVSKAHEGLVWQRFFADATKDGEELGNPAMIDEAVKDIQGALDQEMNEEPLPAFNSEELEECDAMPEDRFSLYVINYETNKNTHKVDLSGHQFLFNINSSAPDYLCLRHDVDGLVWVPKVKRDKDGETTIEVEHVGTFPALGYVQASKEQRKFTTSSPNLTYAVIADSSRRLYVYWQPSDIPSEFDVRNRKSGEVLKQVAKQQVLTLDNNDDILGLAATNEALIVLTESKLCCYKMD